MAEQDNNQDLRVTPGGGAEIGIDAGTDQEQTNRKPSSGVSKQGGVDSHNDDARAAGDKTHPDPESISKTGNAFVGEVGMGTGESTGATGDFVTANEETKRKRNENK